MDFKAQSTPVTIVGDSHKSSKPSFFQKIRSPFSNFSSKKPLAAGLTILMVFALALGVYLTRQTTQLSPQASVDGIDISLKPATIAAATNQEFNVDLFIDTAPTSFQATAIQAKINYDSTKLDLVSTTIGTYFPVTLLAPQNSAGSVSFAVGSNVNQPKTGAGTVATLRFRSKGTTATPQTQITFDSAGTGVSALNNSTNLARLLTPATVTFNPQGSPSPSATSASASPSPAGSNSAADENSFTLQAPTSVTNGQEFQVKVLTRSDAENSNLWNATIKFPQNLVEVVRFDKTGTFITNWTEEFFSNTLGEISLTGGVTNPGFKTNRTNATMTTIVFRAKANGNAAINLVDPSNIFRNSDNAKILQTKRNVAVTVGTASPSPLPSYLHCNTDAQVSGCPTGYVCKPYCPAVNSENCSLSAGKCEVAPASPSPSPSPSRAPSPSPQSKGDGNNDGKVDLQDLSIMFTKWSPAIDIISHIRLDFDDNKRINSFDYSQMKALLIQLGVIRQ